MKNEFLIYPNKGVSRCPVCKGQGLIWKRIVDGNTHILFKAPPTPEEQPYIMTKYLYDSIKEEKCHGCKGKGWITIDIRKENENVFHG